MQKQEINTQIRF